MTSYIDDISKVRSHGNIVLVSKYVEYGNIQSGKVLEQLIKKYKFYNKKTLFFYFWLLWRHKIMTKNNDFEKYKKIYKKYIYYKKMILPHDTPFFIQMIQNMLMKINVKFYFI